MAGVALGRTRGRALLTERGAATYAIDVARASDVAALVALHVPLTEAARQAEIVRESVAAGGCFVARDGAAVAGYVTWDLGFFHRPFVRLLAIGEGHRRRGLGRALLARVETAAASLGELFVSTEHVNAPMRALLGAMGYAPSGSIENVNAAGNPELVFHKRLANDRPARRGSASAP